MLEHLLNLPAYKDLSDADAAAKLSTPIMVPWPNNVTFTSLASVWGLERTVQFKASLAVMQQSADLQAAATSDLAITVLSGVGFRPGDPEASKAGAMFVRAGLCTADEVQASQYAVTYPAGQPVTAADVVTARAVMARRASVHSLRQQVMSVAAGWVAETLNSYDPASEANPPTFADFRTAIANIAG